MLNDISESRTYVAMCNNSDFSGVYFRKFILPENYENNSQNASWFFLNCLDSTACIIGCISFESYSNICEVSPIDF